MSSRKDGSSYGSQLSRNTYKSNAYPESSV